MARTTRLSIRTISDYGKTFYQVVGPKEVSECGTKRYRGPKHKAKRDAEAELADKREVMGLRQLGQRALTVEQIVDFEAASKIALLYGKSLAQMCEIAATWLDRQAVIKSETLEQAWERMILALKAKQVSNAHLQKAQQQLSFAVKNGPHDHQHFAASRRLARNPRRLSANVRGRATLRRCSPRPQRGGSATLH